MNSDPSGGLSAGRSGRFFGRMPDGREVPEYALAHAGGIELRVIPYGGIVTALRVPDRSGRLDDVVLGFDGIEGYLGSHPYFGALIGRVAGRIPRGRLVLDEREYSLVLNDPPNHLHGGIRGFDKQWWDVRDLGVDERGAFLKLARTSPDGEEGYPGRVQVEVIYRVSRDDVWEIEYSAVADRTTPVSLTSHSYFNLSGSAVDDVLGHRLLIHADACTPTDEDMTHLGVVCPLDGRAEDFRDFRRLGDVVPDLLQRHGDHYLVRDGGRDQVVPAAVLEDPVSGRRMEVSTNAPGLQFYSGVSLDGSIRGKSGRRYGPHAGLCLECQGYPAGTHFPAVGDILLRAGECYHQITRHRFTPLPA